LKNVLVALFDINIYYIC